MKRVYRKKVNRKIDVCIKKEKYESNWLSILALQSSIEDKKITNLFTMTKV